MLDNCSSAESSTDFFLAHSQHLCVTFEATLKIRSKFSFLHLGEWPFPQPVYRSVKEKLEAGMPPLEYASFLQALNPYSTSILEVFQASSPFLDKLAIVPSHPNSMHISVSPETQEGDGLSYSCEVVDVLCYPVRFVPGRHLGPKNFHALVWCALRVAVDMTEKPKLQPRLGKDFHITFAMIGWFD